MPSILNADLHCHSVVSDGTLTPEALAERAAANGVELWALTDHDEVAGQQRARDAAHAHGMRYLTGAEIDYQEGLEGAQFVIKNPNAQSTCGCGSSFST